MRRTMTITLLLAVLMAGAALPGGTTAQAPVASPVTAGWQVTDTRTIEVDGEPVAL